MPGYPAHFDYEEPEGDSILDMPITMGFVTRMRIATHYLSTASIPSAMHPIAAWLGEWMNELDEAIKEVQEAATESVESMPPDYSDPPY